MIPYNAELEEKLLLKMLSQLIELIIRLKCLKWTDVKLPDKSGNLIKTWLKNKAKNLSQ